MPTVCHANLEVSAAVALRLLCACRTALKSLSGRSTWRMAANLPEGDCALPWSVVVHVPLAQSNMHPMSSSSPAENEPSSAITAGCAQASRTSSASANLTPPTVIESRSSDATGNNAGQENRGTSDPSKLESESTKSRRTCGVSRDSWRFAIGLVVVPLSVGLLGLAGTLTGVFLAARKQDTVVTFSPGSMLPPANPPTTAPNAGGTDSMPDILVGDADRASAVAMRCGCNSNTGVCSDLDFLCTRFLPELCERGDASSAPSCCVAPYGGNKDCGNGDVFVAFNVVCWWIQNNCADIADLCDPDVAPASSSCGLPSTISTPLSLPVSIPPVAAPARPVFPPNRPDAVVSVETDSSDFPLRTVIAIAVVGIVMLVVGICLCFDNSKLRCRSACVARKRSTRA